MGSEQWEIAGFTDALSGRLGKQIQAGDVWLPENVTIEGPNLVWDVPYHAKKTEPAPEVLNEFVALCQHADSKIAGKIRMFAERQGALQVNATRQNNRCSEPLSTWIHFSQRADAILNIAARLSDGKSGSEKDWRVVNSALGHEIGPRIQNRLDDYPSMIQIWVFADRPSDRAGIHRLPLDHQRTFLMAEVLAWLKLSRAGFALFYDLHKREWRFEIDYNGQLLAFLAIQLALTIAGGSLFICSSCGHAYNRTKKPPKPGQANYCDKKSCGRNAAMKHAERRRREKVSLVHAMDAKGKSASEIASELDIPVTRVNRLLRRENKHGKKTRSR